MNGELRFKLPSIPSEPGPAVDIVLTVKATETEGDALITIEQPDGPNVLIENQKGHLVVYVWKTEELKDTGAEPVKIECESRHG
jgi:hypothetical protein